MRKILVINLICLLFVIGSVHVFGAKEEGRYVRCFQPGTSQTARTGTLQKVWWSGSFWGLYNTRLTRATCENKLKGSYPRCVFLKCSESSRNSRLNVDGDIYCVGESIYEKKCSSGRLV